jgi:hypothetical protein
MDIKSPFAVRDGLPQMYNPGNDTWSTVPVWTFGRYAVATSSVYAPERNYIVTDSKTQAYDFETDSFAYGAVVPTYRGDFAVAVADDKIYTIGGLTVTQNSLAYYIETGEMYNQTFYATVEAYTPFGYGAVPPKITVYSPVIGNYTLGNVSLAFAVNKPATWMGYSLDGQDNITVTGNITLAGLSVGLHNVTVYAKDEFENIGASGTLTFSIVEPEPTPESFPIVPVAAASIATVATVGVGLFVYFKKRKH